MPSGRPPIQIPKETLSELTAKGLTPKEMSTALKISQATVYIKLKAAGIPSNAIRGHVPIQIPKTILLDLTAKGFTLRQMSAAIGVTYSTVYNKLKVLGVPLNMCRRLGTHCKVGHEMTEENTYWTRDGTRRCKKCLHDYHKAKYQERKRKEK